MNPNHLRELCWESKTSGELSGSIPGAQEAFLRTVFLTLNISPEFGSYGIFIIVLSPKGRSQRMWYIWSCTLAVSLGDSRSLISQRTKIKSKWSTCMPRFSHALEQQPSPNGNPCFPTKSQSWFHSLHTICRSVLPGFPLHCAPHAGIHSTH